MEGTGVRDRSDQRVRLLDSLGDLYFLYGEFEKARAKYQQALSIRPDFPSNWKLAYLYAMDGDFDAALRWVDDTRGRATRALEEGKAVARERDEEFTRQLLAAGAPPGA